MLCNDIENVNLDTTIPVISEGLKYDVILLTCGLCNGKNLAKILDLHNWAPFRTKYWISSEIWHSSSYSGVIHTDISGCCSMRQTNQMENTHIAPKAQQWK